MKFPIKFKLVGLGAVLSIVVTTIAIVFGNVEYRRRGKERQMATINAWLDNMSEDFNGEEYGGNYTGYAKQIRSYIEESYAINSEAAPDDASYADQKNFYKNIFRQLYAIEGFGSYRMSEEELKFRENYQDFLFLLTDAKTATNARKVFVGFISDDKTLFYMGDEYSYKKITREDAYLPGDRIYNFNAPMTLKGDYYDCNYDGLLHRVLPIKDTDGATVAYVFLQYDFSEVENDANSLMTTEIITLSITSLLMIIAYAVFAHFLVNRNVNKLTKSATEFTDDLSSGKDLEKKDPNIRSHDEISVLSDSFIALEEGIINFVDVLQKETQEKERVNAELNVATNIQLSALPNNIYDDKNVTIRAFIKSAKEVGGDFYDYFYLDDHRLAIIISDVSGKGVPAALFMMKSKELIKSAIHMHDNLVDAAKEVNTKLVRNNKEGLFVTSFLGIIDFEKNIINFVNAGHEKPYIVSKNKVTKLDGTSNFVMGGEEDFVYAEESHPFKKGEFIFLFTDGLNESINDKQEEFSYERIVETLDQNKKQPLNRIIKAMTAKLEEFVGEEEQFDDVTMLVIKNRDDELHLTYDKKEYDIITDIVDAFEETFAYLSSEVRGSAGIIIDELVNNLVSYEAREDLVVEADFKIKKDDLVITISSNGADYNPFANHQEKYTEEFHPEMKEGGFGLSLIKNFAKSYKYQYKNNHSIVEITVAINK